VSAFQVIQHSFRFDCRQCGNCCTGDQQVWLTPDDLRRMALFLRYAHTRLLFENHYVKWGRGEHGARRPIMRFKSLKKFRFCPFLINDLEEDGTPKGLCRLHPYHKPLICRLAPVGRVWHADSERSEWLFVKPAPDCPGVESPVLQELATWTAPVKHSLSEEEHYLRQLNQLIARGAPDKAYEKLCLFPVTSEPD